MQVIIGETARSRADYLRESLLERNRHVETLQNLTVIISGKEACSKFAEKRKDKNRLIKEFLLHLWHNYWRTLISIF